MSYTFEPVHELEKHVGSGVDILLRLSSRIQMMYSVIYTPLPRLGSVCRLRVIYDQ